MGSIFSKERICAVVAASGAHPMLAQLATAFEQASVVELRLDWLSSPAEIERFLAMIAVIRTALPQFSQVTLIATCRSREAGGKFRGGIQAEIKLLKLAAEAGCAWVDFEIESASKLKRGACPDLFAPAHCLISFHDFRKTPANLALVVRKLSRAGGHAIKIAAQARSFGDATRLIQLARGKENVVAIPMGESALPIRVLALKAGSALAYASVTNATAPGQISFEEMKNLYQADRLGDRTKVYGVIGDPIGHSLSPRMQNAAFQAARMDAVYLPFRVRDLTDFLASVKTLGILGFSVTIPHKKRILRYLQGCDPLAAKIGAVNTVAVKGGKLYGYNTDYMGVLCALEKRMPLKKSRVLLFGAGGSARAAAFALAQAGAAVYVCARRESRARELAKAVGGNVVPRSALRSERFDAIVNATPVGMYPKEGESPLLARELNCKLVFDLIYRPRQTRLLQLAAARGIETVSGVDMFVAQGAAQWEIWTGKPAPVEVMREAVESTLEREERSRSIQ